MKNEVKKISRDKRFNEFHKYCLDNLYDRDLNMKDGLLDNINMLYNFFGSDAKDSEIFVKSIVFTYQDSDGMMFESSMVNIDRFPELKREEE